MAQFPSPTIGQLQLVNCYHLICHAEHGRQLISSPVMVKSSRFPSPRAALPIGGLGLQHGPSQQDHAHLQDQAHEMVDWKYQHFLDNLISLFICLSS